MAPFLSILLLLFALRLSGSGGDVVHAVAVWPQPARMTTGTLVRTLSSAFVITAPPEWRTDLDFQSALARTTDQIKQQSITPYTTDFGAAQASQAGAHPVLDELRIDVGQPGGGKRAMRTFAVPTSSSSYNTSKSSLKSLSTQPLETLDEAYTLTIDATQSPAVLLASNPLAALRGLTTFLQLVHSAPSAGSSPSLYLDGLPLHIDDAPAFPYRGIMLDTARNYLSPTVMKRQMDAMALLKLNQLHWHLTDTSSWPIGLEQNGMDVLAIKGAYGKEMIYTPDVIKDLVAYGAQRGINIIVEIDMPGHQFMGVRDYPGELIVCGDETNWLDWGNEPPTGHLDVRKPAAAKLMKAVFSELAEYLPGPYVSTGNDEVEPQCYGLEKKDVAGMDAILAPFVDDVHSHLRSIGKTPVVWEEAALNFPTTATKLKPGTLVEAWTGSANVEKLLQSNDAIRLIHAPVDFFYLDCGMGGWLGNNVNGASWCAFVTWQKQYSFDPLNGTETVKGGAERIMGGESALWAEQVDEANVESLLWPRAAAGAEVFWTGPSFLLNDDKTPQKRTVRQALPRLHEARGRLRAMDVRASPLQPMWCALRPGRCDLPTS